MLPRSHLLLVLVASTLAAACHSASGAPPVGDARSGSGGPETDRGAARADALERLVEQEELSPFDPESSEVVGIAPEQIAGRGRGDYSLVYVLSEDGAAIETRFRGPSGAVSAGLGVARRDDGDLFRLVATMPGCPELATLAAWRRDPSGRVTDVHVRRTPVAEVRVSALEPGQLVADRQWRPIEGGVPVGEWR